MTKTIKHLEAKHPKAKDKEYNKAKDKESDGIFNDLFTFKLSELFICFTIQTLKLIFISVIRIQSVC